MTFDLPVVYLYTHPGIIVYDGNDRGNDRGYDGGNDGENYSGNDDGEESTLFSPPPPPTIKYNYMYLSRCVNK